MGKSTKARQLSLVFGNKHGGWRRGAGRKPKGAQAGVAHRPRVEFVRRSPVFVTQRLGAGLLLRVGWRKHGRFSVRVCPRTEEEGWEEGLHRARRARLADAGLGHRRPRGSARGR